MTDDYIVKNSVSWKIIFSFYMAIFESLSFKGFRNIARAFIALSGRAFEFSESRKIFGNIFRGVPWRKF